MTIRTFYISGFKCELFLDELDFPVRLFMNSGDLPGYGRLYEWIDVPPEIQNQIETLIISTP